MLRARAVLAIAQRGNGLEASGNALSGTLVRVVPKSSEMLEPTVVTGKRAGD